MPPPQWGLYLEGRKGPGERVKSTGFEPQKFYGIRDTFLRAGFTFGTSNHKRKPDDKLFSNDSLTASCGTPPGADEEQLEGSTFNSICCYDDDLWLIGSTTTLSNHPLNINII